ncbi:GIY-YIG nuclease family protein (plasmid) [Streptomyces sp. NBC_01590]|uniref:GIY-YIG nuclease family protein n=1 Tax=Streptomyces sp. NBC_01590 TaxID=2975887 RepID=UPI002F912B5F
MNDTLCAVAECFNYPLIKHPIELCRRHALMISLNVTDVLHATALAGRDVTGIDIERVSAPPNHIWTQPSHQPVVYFLANGDRVKIGTSTNIAARVSALSFRRSNALILLQGGQELEAALHSHFGADRIGRTEWFALSPRIHAYITRRQEAEAALRQPTVATAPAERSVPVRKVIAPRKSLSTDDKILRALKESADPRGLGLSYVHKDQIGALVGVSGSTLNNALTKLTKAGSLHRQTKRGQVIRGMYGLTPDAVEAETD